MRPMEYKGLKEKLKIETRFFHPISPEHNQKGILKSNLKLLKSPFKIILCQMKVQISKIIFIAGLH